jgi:hypothetical protein
MVPRISRKIASPLVTVMVVGCVTVPSSVVPIGKDTYQLSMTGVGFATQANTNVKALQAANEYCDKLGKHLVFQHNGEAGVYGWSPRQSNLTFLCLDANDPDYMHAKAQPLAAAPPETPPKSVE